MAGIDEALVVSAADSPALVRRAAGRSGTTAPRRLIRRAALGRCAAVRTLSDVALIDLVARGDRSAFNEVYLRYGAPAFRLAQRITVDPRLAEHVTQDVFLTIWRDAGRFDARRARVATWLLTITHHKAVDVVRAEQVRRTESDAQINDIADESIAKLLRRARQEAWTFFELLP